MSDTDYDPSTDASPAPPEQSAAPTTAELPTPAGGEPIVAQSADGVSHEFPAGTLPGAVDKAMKAYAEEHRDRSTVMDHLRHGFMNPVEGGAQLLSNMLPADATKSIDAFNNWLADKTGMVAKLPEGGMNQRVKDRAAEYDALKGHDQSVDFSEAAGDLLNPINYIGGVALRAPKAVAAIPVVGKAAAASIDAMLGGAGAGAVAPVTDDNYGATKAEQTGVGAALGGALGLAGSAVSKGVEGLGQYIARNYPDNLATQAVQTVMRRISQDEKTTGISASDAIDLVNNLKKPMTLADIGGENTKALAGNVARQPGESRAVASDFLNQRDEGAAQRLSADIGEHLHSGDTVHQATEALIDARSAAARPSYNSAMALQNVWSPRLAQFFEDPAVKAGLARGYDIERMVALAEGRPITTTQMGVDLDSQGNAKLLGTPNMRLLDMAKQGLDALVADERNELTGRLSARGVALDKLRRSYVQTIDGLDPSGAYKAARSQWAGYSQAMDAIKQGRALFKASPEENAAAVQGLSDPNKEFYRLGVADTLKERLAKAGFANDEAKQIIRNPWMRDQLRPAFKSEGDFNKFVDSVTDESTMFTTKQATLGGSQTAGRLAEDTGGMGDNLTKGVSFMKDVLSGHPLGAIKHAWQFYRDIGLKPNPELNAKIAQLLFTTDIPQEAGRQIASGKAPLLYNPAAKAASVVRFVPRTTAAGLNSGFAASLNSRNPQDNPVQPPQ